MIERIKLLFPWYREIRKLERDLSVAIGNLAEARRKLADSDEQIHELAASNRELIRKAKDYRKQLTDAGIAPKRVNSGDPVERLTPYPAAGLPGRVVEFGSRKGRSALRLYGSALDDNPLGLGGATNNAYLEAMDERDE